MNTNKYTNIHVHVHFSDRRILDRTRQNKQKHDKEEKRDSNAAEQKADPSM